MLVNYEMRWETCANIDGDLLGYYKLEVSSLKISAIIKAISLGVVAEWSKMLIVS